MCPKELGADKKKLGLKVFLRFAVLKIFLVLSF